MDSKEIEAAKKYSVFHVREHGQEEYFQLERSLDIVDAAHLLREYLRKDRQDSFPDFCGIRQRITAGEFDQLVGVHMETPKKVTGAFVLDFDKKEFSAVDATDGWCSAPSKCGAVCRTCRAAGDPVSMSVQQAVLDEIERCRAPPCLLMDSLMDVLALRMTVGEPTAYLQDTATRVLPLRSAAAWCKETKPVAVVLPSGKGWKCPHGRKPSPRF